MFTNLNNAEKTHEITKSTATDNTKDNQTRTKPINNYAQLAFRVQTAFKHGASVRALIRYYQESDTTQRV